jgi:hypothetical protein
VGAFVGHHVGLGTLLALAMDPSSTGAKSKIVKIMAGNVVLFLL